MHLRRRRQVTTAGLAVFAVALAACSSSSSSSSTSTSTTSPSSGTSSSAALNGTLNGSGSTFQLTFQQEAIQSFKTVQSSMTVNYNGVGSGTGRSNLAAGTVNYAGSDSKIPAAEASTFKSTVLYFPVVIGPITVSYNLSGLSKPLQLSAPTIAQIFEAKITTWNNSAIAADNPGVTLPSTAITICRRSDSSGTTQNFSEFLVEGAPGVWKLGSDSVTRGASGAAFHVDDGLAMAFIADAVCNGCRKTGAPGWRRSSASARR